MENGLENKLLKTPIDYMSFQQKVSTLTNTKPTPLNFYSM